MFKKVLVPLDRSALAEKALAPAADIARKLNARVDVVMVHEHPALVGLRRSAWNEEQAFGERRYLECVADRLEKHELIGTTHAILEGDVVQAICERAHDIDADLIVMTSHGRTGFNRTRLGSVADALIRKSAVPVLMIRQPDPHLHTPAPGPLFGRILVPVDGSPLSHEILSTAAELARCNEAQLVLLRVIEPVPLFVLPAIEDITSGMAPTVPTSIQDTVATEALCASARTEVAELARKLAQEGIAHVDPQVVVATRVAPAIADFAVARDIDLIAMSTHGRGASRWLLGSVADEVLQSTRLPMLLVRPAQIEAAAAAAKPAQSAKPTSASASVGQLPGYLTGLLPRPAHTVN